MASSRRRARATNRRRDRSLLRRIPSRSWFWGLAKRVGARSLPSALLVGGLALVCGASYLSYHWITHSPRFAVGQVEVKGNLALSKTQVVEALDLDADANIFRTGMETLETRLLSNPWIAQASVSRSFPDGLEVEIAEEQASAAVELDGLYLINAEGRPFKRANVDSQELDGLSIITGFSREEFLADAKDGQTQLQYAISAMTSYHANANRPRLGEVHMDKRHGITLITFEEAIAIHLGSPEGDDFEDRYRTFDSAWSALDSEEHAAARAFRIVDRTPSDQVTIAFAGN